MKEIILNEKVITSIDVTNPLDVITIRIGEDVEEISDEAFEGLYNLHNIYISENNKLRRIGKRVCKNCVSLKNINLEDCDKLEEIDDEAFSNCTNISIIRLPNSVKRIGKKAFEKSGIINIRLSSELKEIDDEAFSDCRSLTFIIIPSETKVSDEAFSSTDTEIIQINSDTNTDMGIESNNEPDSIENKENVIIINQEGKILSVPIREKPLYIFSHEFGIEYLAGKYLNTFIEDKAMNWALSNSLATIYMVDTYSEIFDILGFPNDLSIKQVETIKAILGTHKDNIVYGVLEIIDGHVKRSCDDTELTAGTYINNFENIVTNNCRINYLNNLNTTPKGPKKN